MKNFAIFFSILFFCGFSSWVAAQEPTLMWAKSVGVASGYDEGRTVSLDAAGNVYAAGYFSGRVDFDPGPDTFYLVSNGWEDLYVQKFDPDGNWLWAVSAGGAGRENWNSIATGAAGYLYVAGRFQETVDFDPGPGSTVAASNGDDDIFLLKLDADGHFQWVTSMGSSASDGGLAVALDAIGNVYLTGYFNDTIDADPGPGVLPLITNGSSDIFIQKLDAAGQLLWAKQIGGPGLDVGRAMAVDAAGNVHITGPFSNLVDFDPGEGVYLIDAGALDFAYILKLDADGHFQWVKSLGNMQSAVYSTDIALDAAGSVYSTGVFNEATDFDPGAGIYTLTSHGLQDIYIQKLDAAGNFRWAKSMGGEDFDYGYALMVQAAGFVFSTGEFRKTVDFNPGAGNWPLTALGGGSAYIQKLDTAGNFVWARAIGGSDGNCAGLAIAANETGQVYTSGRFEGTVDFNPGGSTYNLTTSWESDAYLLKLSAAGALSWVKSTGGLQSSATINGIAADAAGNIFSTGLFEGTVDFDPERGGIYLSAQGDGDIFIQKSDDSGNLLWVYRIGGLGYDYGISVALDAAGNVYMTGYFNNTVDFDPGPAVYFLTASIPGDAFIQKLDANGQFVWAKQVGGSGVTAGQYITLDAAGNVYAAGYFSEIADFDPGPAINPLSANGSFDIYLLKLDNDGHFQWAKSTGGPEYDFPGALTLDVFGNILCTGEFMGTADFDPGPGVFPLSAYSYYDIFIQKLDADGHFLWAKSMGGFDFDSGYAITTDAAGNVYSSGEFAETVDFDPDPVSAFFLSSNGAGDSYLLKLDASGNFVWVLQTGGSDNDYGGSIQLDTAGNIYITGSFWGFADFDPGPETAYLWPEGLSDIYVQKLSPTGELLWVRSISGEGWDGMPRLLVDANDQIIIKGSFDLGITDVDPGPDTYLLSANGSDNTFIAKWRQGTSGIVQTGFERGVLAYPNPTTGELYIDLGGQYRQIQTEITTITGQTISRKYDAVTGTLLIHLDGPAGLYFVTVRDDAGRKAVLKVVKEWR